MTNLILVRHGQSIWNAENRFTGWVDSGLSTKGKNEAKLAGELIRNQNLIISFSYTSFLTRASHTLKIILDEIDKVNLQKAEAWQLNERHYGSLTGLDKEETKINLGEELFFKYRRSWDMAPPKLNKSNKYLSSFSKLNSKIPTKKIPLTESLKNTYDRVIPYYKKKIQPNLLLNKNILMVAHGNSLRALCKHLFQINDKKINLLEIPTGNPLLISFNKDISKIDQAYYLNKKREKKLFFGH